MEVKMSVSEKLRTLLDKEGRGAQARLAKYLNVPRNYISRWVNDPKYGVPRDQIPKIANYFGVSSDYLLSDDAKMPLSRKIPIIGRASCGVPGEYYTDEVEYMEVPMTMYSDGAYAVAAEGDSMSPKINDGDIVICNNTENIASGDVVHYTIDGESGIKKIKISDNGETIMLIPFNTTYDPIIVSNLEKHTISMSRCSHTISKL